MKKTAVIMAGGSGERFWPQSRKTCPKQLLPLVTDEIMLVSAINRVKDIIAPEDIFIITSKVLLEPIRRVLPILPPENVIAEPFKRNTAPCLALAAAFIKAKYEGKYNENEISVAVLTADQDIRPEEAFSKNVSEVMEFVGQNEVICTVGIPPCRPETGYGYLEIDSEKNVGNIRKVKAFREKPALEVAEKYAKSGIHFWNSGMFFFRLDTFISGMKKYLPEVGGKINIMTEKYLGQTATIRNEAFADIADIFEQFPDISIDYGLMEKYDKIYAKLAEFDWDDVGSWDALDRVKQKDENGNICEGILAETGCKNTVFVNKSGGKIAVGAVGLEDFVVVVTDDAVLVCPKDRVQEVKKCVGILKNNGNEKFV